MKPMMSVLNIARRLKLYALGVLALGGIGGSLYYALAPGPTEPWTIQFLNPSDGQRLSERDDKSGDSCADGFTHDVVLKTNAPDGTSARLLVSGLNAGTTTVSGGAAAWSAVKMPSMGDVVFVAMVGTARAVSAARVRCAGAPRCDLIGPTWDDRHPTINGVPRTVTEIGADAGTAYANAGVCPWGQHPDAGMYCTRDERAGGDNDRGAGMGPGLSLDVQTDVAAGSLIKVWLDGALRHTLYKDNSGIYQRITGITVGADGETSTHTVRLECIPATGLHGFSVEAHFDTDTAAPQLVVETPTIGAERYPLTGGKLQVCASTTSPDALDLGTANLCASVGTSTPACAQMTTNGLNAYWSSIDAGPSDAGFTCEGGSASCSCTFSCSAGTYLVDGSLGCTECWVTDAGYLDGGSGPAMYSRACPPCVQWSAAPTRNGACVLLDVPGSAAFDLLVTLQDLAGNVATTTIQGIAGPADGGTGVVIVEPPYGLGPDPNTHILADDQLTRRKDIDSDAAGAQYTVIACTSAPADASAALYAGVGDAALVQVGASVGLISDGGCGPGMPYQATFPLATLPESLGTDFGGLAAGTRLRVVAGGASSPFVDTWIDIHVPNAWPDHACAADASFNACPNVVTLQVTDPAGNTETYQTRTSCPLTFHYSALPVRCQVVNNRGSFSEVVLVPSSGL